VLELAIPWIDHRHRWIDGIASQSQIVIEFCVWVMVRACALVGKPVAVREFALLRDWDALEPVSCPLSGACSRMHICANTIGWGGLRVQIQHHNIFCFFLVIYIYI